MKGNLEKPKDILKYLLVATAVLSAQEVFSQAVTDTIDTEKYTINTTKDTTDTISERKKFAIRVIPSQKPGEVLTLSKSIHSNELIKILKEVKKYNVEADELHEEYFLEPLELTVAKKAGFMERIGEIRQQKDLWKAEYGAHYVVIIEPLIEESEGKLEEIEFKIEEIENWYEGRKKSSNSKD